MPSDQKKFSAGTSSAWMMGVSIAERAFGLIIFVLLARLLDIKDFGVVAICLLVLDFINVLITTGIREYIVTRDRTNNKFLSTCFFGVFSSSLLIALLAFPITYFFTFGDESGLTSEILLFIAFIPLISSFNMIQQSIMQRAYLFKKMALYNFLATVIAGTIAVYLAFEEFGAWALVAYRFLQIAFNTVLNMWATKFFPTLKFDFELFKKLYQFSIPLMLSECLNFWSSRVLELFVSIFFGPANFALLAIARKFSRLVTQVSYMPLRQVCLSYIKNAENKGASFVKFSAYVSFIVAPILILLGVFADGYVPIIFGAQWNEAVPVIRILAFASIATCLMYYFSLPLVVAGKTKDVFKVNTLFFALSFGVGLVCYQISFQQYLIVQIALVNLICIFKIYYLKKKALIVIDDIVKYFLPVIISVLFFALSSVVVNGFVFDLIRQNNILDLISISLSSIILIGAYVGFLFIFFRKFFRQLFSFIIERKAN